MRRLLNTRRTALLVLLFGGMIRFLSPTTLPAASVTLAWDANSETNLAGYKVHYGSASGQYPTVIDVGNVVAATVSNLIEGPYYFVVTAYDIEGLESDFSNEVSYSPQTPLTNDPPVISSIADQTVAEDTSTSVISFQVTDSETPASSLTLSASSSNPVLAPVSNILFGGSGTNRTVRVTPATNQFGTAVITLTVTDAGGATASKSFTLTVQAVNDPPVISSIADQTVPQGERVGPLAFNVSDPEIAAERLTVVALSSNPNLVPASNIRVEGVGTNRTITIIPRLNSVGTATVSLFVGNGTLASERRFAVTVRPLSEMPRCPLTLLTTGRGTIEPRLNGSNLVVGKTYTLVARPAANQLFSGWSGSITASTNRLRFIMQSNLVLQANFIPDPFLPRRGSYNGLFYETNEVRHESSGFFTVRLSPRGLFSANVKLAGRRFPITGRFGLDGLATRTLGRPGTNTVTVDLCLDMTNVQSRLRGQISDGTWTAQLLADRAIYDVTTNCGVYSGTYTMSIPGGSDPTTGPEGSGFGTITVNRKGRLRLYGELADGKSIAQAIPLSAQGDWPLYVPLYSGNGSVLSWIKFTNTATDSLHGLLSWIKPARPLTRYYPNGFTNETSVFGSSFRSVAGTTNHVLDVTNGLLVLGGGGLTSVFTNAVTLVAANKVLNASTNTLSVRINSASGMLLGSFVDPATRHIHLLRGVVLQQQKVAVGYVSGTNATGFVQLEQGME